MKMDLKQNTFLKWKLFFQKIYFSTWKHREEIFAKEKGFIKKGGQWISHVSI